MSTFHPISQFSTHKNFSDPLSKKKVSSLNMKTFQLCLLFKYLSATSHSLQHTQCCIPFHSSRVCLGPLCRRSIIIGISHAGMRFRKIEKLCHCFWALSNHRFETQFSFCAAFKSQLSEFSCKFQQLNYALWLRRCSDTVSLGDDSI